MAKTRAQRKAEKRRREAQQQQSAGEQRQEESRAQHDTQAPLSGEVAEAEAVIQTGADTADYGEHTHQRPDQGSDEGQPRSAAPGVLPEPVAPEAPEAPAPSRADVGRTEKPQESKRELRKREKEREKEERKRARRRDAEKAQAEKAERRRGGVLGFFASCWAELKKVQWPDRDTLVQASAVTVIFVAVMAAYLGALDAGFNWLIKQIL
jgi:preprotein translocase SecE subunit